MGAFRAGGSSFVIPPWASLLLPCVPSTPPPSPQILQSSACAQIGLSGASGIGVARRTGTVRQSATDSSPLSRCMCAHTQARTRTVCECVETPPGRGGAHAKKTAQGLGAGGGMLLRDSACHPHLPGLEVSCSPPPRTPLPGWDPRSRCRLLRGTSPVPAARSAPPVPGAGVRPGAGPARPGRPLRGRGSSRVGSAEPGARCPPGSQRGSRRRGTPLRFRARRLTAAPQPASSSSLPIKCRNSGL